jgi:hypothetical protein
MKRIGIHILLLFIWSLLASSAFGQNTWRLMKDRGWIQVYQGDMDHSSYKRIKVECTIDGTYDKLLEVLNNVKNHKNWIYNSKTAYIIKQVNQYEYYYYTETTLPWPLLNRDAVVHIKINRDSMDRCLKIDAVGVPDYLSSVSGKVRVPRSANSWKVTIPAPGKLHIVYIFEADPGGHLPPLLVNSFVDKGPYESFRNLAEQLRR